MNGYDLTRNWYNFKFENPDLVKSYHSDLYFYIIDLWNRLGQKDKFGLPTSVTMECLSIKSYNTYKKALDGLIEFGFIKIISNSKNQYESKVIAISYFDKATDKALDKATIKANDEANNKAHNKAIDTIIKQYNNTTTKQLNKEQVTIILDYFDNLEKNELEIFLKKITTPKEELNYQEIIDVFNSVCFELPNAKLTDSRKKLINARIKDYSLEHIGIVFRKVVESDFLSGRKKDWKATFDWIMSKNNFVKILEDNYKNLNNNGTSKSTEQQFAEALNSEVARSIKL